MDIYEMHRILRVEAEASMGKVVEINRQLRAAGTPHGNNGLLALFPPFPAPWVPSPPAAADAAAAPASSLYRRRGKSSPSEARGRARSR
jgi:hypothetical protein